LFDQIVLAFEFLDFCAKFPSRVATRAIVIAGSWLLLRQPGMRRGIAKRA